MDSTIPGGGGWGCAAGTHNPYPKTRQSSAAPCNPKLVERAKIPTLSQTRHFPETQSLSQSSHKTSFFVYGNN